MWLRRHPTDREKAKYALSDLESPHWDVVSGGRQAPTPQPFVFGYVSCDGALEGEVAHSGSHGPCPHRIKVCVVAKDNSKAIFDSIRRQAGKKPRMSTNAMRALEAITAAGPAGITNQALMSKASLSKAYGPGALAGLEREGKIESTTEVRPGSDGKNRRQKVWRLAESSDH